MRFRIFIAAVLTAVVSFQASALKLKIKKDTKPRLDYTEWIALSDVPAQEDGVKMFYPSTEPVDSAAVYTGQLTAEGLTARQILLAAMVYAVDNFDIDNGEGFSAIDYDGNKATMSLKTTCGTNSREATYMRDITLDASDGLLRFKVSGVNIRYREKGLIPRTLPMEELHPESNSRHNELVMELTRITSAYMDGMTKYISTRGDISAPHLAQLKDGKVIVGMNPDEVKLILGAPWEVRKSGEKLRWIYGNETVVIFVDGVVSRVI